ncbi:MAG TPA: FimV/HubP family polar landmark protein [Steroidobacteraceae bacterium]|nr:FimV/HubP family polar landmark protein [Steroidobacteraceae bacterium]
MFAKRSSRALALLLALPSAAFALGLGDIHLLSPLNAPLDAEIEITDVAPDEINTLRAHLASREMFSQNGLDYPTYLTSVQLRTVQTADGHQIIKIKSADPITDPFVTLLVDVTWSHGQLVREYTMLLDPPVYTPGQSAVANAPVAAPTTGADTRAGTIARTAEAAAPAAAAPAAAESAQAAPAEAAAAEPAPAEAAASAAAPPAPPPARSSTKAAAASAAASPAPEGPSASPAPPAPSAEQGANAEHVVQRGETLSEIARGVTGATTNDARTRSWMLAIYQANPKAFDQNMNLLRSGSVLRIPDAAQAQAIPPAEATAEINRQFAAWRSTAAPAAAAGETAAAPASGAAQASQAGRLRLVTPSETASAGTGTAANSAQVSALKGRVQELEGQLAESKRLLDLKNQDLARLQSELAAKQTAKAPTPPPAPVPAPAPAPAKPPVAQAAPPPAPTPAPVEKPAAEKPAAEQPAPKEEQPAPPVAAAPPAAVSKPLPKPVPANKPAPAPAAEGGSILDTIMGYWWVLALIALVFAAVAGLRYLRSRRASEFDDSLGRLAVAAVAGASGAGGALGGAGPARGSGGFEAPTMRAMPLTEPEPDIRVEETGTHERPRMAAAGAAPPPPPAAKHVTADDTISSETAINLDQGDPLAEADFHMAYGLYDQAADLIRIAIGREPTRRDLKLKLLEVFFVWGNKEQFLQTAHELAQTRAEAAPGEWEKILIMGKQLAPEDPLFSGGAAVGGAAAGGVDLNLEGGQSRVDFDLLGEPVPTEQGVDLDIGSAVGEGTAQMTEATTGVTDRNLTVLQGARGGNAAATGSTRQMTAKMRQQAADTEGPTVEQPTLEEPDERTVRAPMRPAVRAGSAEQTAELAIDDLGLDLGTVDTQEQPALGVGADAQTMVAGLDEKTRKKLEDTAEQAAAHAKTSTTGQWQFDQEELETALTQAGPLQDGSQTSRLAALRGDTVDIDVSSSATTGTHPEIRTSGVDLDLGTGTYPGNGGKLDLDVGTATVPDAAFAATQRLANEDLALPDLEPVTMSEVGTKLDLARAYMDMGDPDGARNILEEVMSEGSAAQKQEAQRLMESLPG